MSQPGGARRAPKRRARRRGEEGTPSDGAEASLPQSEPSADPEGLEPPDHEAEQPSPRVRKRRTIFNSRRSRSKAMRRLTTVLNIVSVLVILAGLWMAYEAFQARRQLQAFYNHGQQIPSLVAKGEATAAQTQAKAAADSANSARRHTDGPLWALAGRFPIIGDDVSAVTMVAESADVLGQKVLPTVIKAAKTVDPKKLAPRNGKVNVEPLAAMTAELEAANAEAERVGSGVQAIDPRGLLPILRGPVVSAQNGFTKITSSTRGAMVTAKVLPWLFGKGTHRILVSFETNAEIRSLGGMPGSFGVLTITDGKLSFGEQGTNKLFNMDRSKPFGKLTPEQKNVFSMQPVIYPQDTNMLPDIAEGSANLANAWARAQKPVDGVLSIDTVATSYLMKAMPPISSHGLTVTGSNAASVLLNEVYKKVPGATDQDNTFTDITSQAMKQITGNLKDPASFASALLQGLDESRVRMWVKQPDMQQLLASTRIGGDTSASQPKAPQFGLFLNNATASKLEYYLDYEASTTPVACDKSGVQQVSMSVDFKSNVPADPGKLPVGILGLHEHYPPGVISTSITVMSPPGGQIGRMFINGAETDAYLTNLDGKRVLMTNLVLKPGQRKTYTFEMYGAQGQINDAQVRITPAIRNTGLGTLRPTGCF
ncbi:MAG TPA: DUF4012 domain-containing protein [Marmoricola sp.]|nr:DUF4012 domain-containing protein [Marmoricola sp.]